jgi:enoyl-CoA hydratase
MAAALDEAEADDDVRVVVVTGSPRLDGRLCFWAGGDVKAQAQGARRRSGAFARSRP